LPWLSDVTLQSSSRGSGPGSSQVNFQIVATLSPTGGK
jgi:hypothetical protein